MTQPSSHLHVAPRVAPSGDAAGPPPEVSGVSAPAPGWQAHLTLGFVRRGPRTVLAERRHTGPLLVQKPLYPEGESICHTVIVHPPGGIVGGDQLGLDIALGAGTHAVLTTPGATKWYKAPRDPAHQTITLNVGPNARLDWLPQENIVFDAARAAQRIDVILGQEATAIGWDATLLGRQAAGEQWTRGQWRSRLRLCNADGTLLWADQAVLGAANGLPHAPPALDCLPVFATLWAVAPCCTAALAESLASGLPYTPVLRAGVTCLPGNVLVLRVLGQQMEAVRALMVAHWLRLRPLVHGVAGVLPRIWAT